MSTSNLVIGKQVAHLWQRDRATLSNLMTGGVGLYCKVFVAVAKLLTNVAMGNVSSRRFEGGGVILRLNFMWKGYLSRQNLWTARWGNGYTTTLPLEVFTQRSFVADLIRLQLNYIFKKQKIAFWATIWRHGVPYALHLWSVGYSSLESRGRLPIPIHHNWTFRSFTMETLWFTISVHSYIYYTRKNKIIFMRYVIMN